MNCPYCKSPDVDVWTKKIEIGIIVYRCYSCGQLFEIRNVPNCGEQTFHHGDNFPNFEIERQKFKDMGVVPTRTKDNLADLWIDLWEYLKEKEKK